MDSGTAVKKDSVWGENFQISYTYFLPKHKLTNKVHTQRPKPKDIPLPSSFVPVQSACCNIFSQISLAQANYLL